MNTGALTESPAFYLLVTAKEMTLRTMNDSFGVKSLRPDTFCVPNRALPVLLGTQNQVSHLECFIQNHTEVAVQADHWQDSAESLGIVTQN
jgi:hypothetical protein